MCLWLDGATGSQYERMQILGIRHPLPPTAPDTDSAAGSSQSLNNNLQCRVIVFTCHQVLGMHRAANPPDFRGSLPILRSILRLYDLTMQTPDFSHVSSARQR